MLACSGENFEDRKFKRLNVSTAQLRRERPLTSHSTSSIKKSYINKQRKSYVDPLTVLDSEYDYTIAVQQD